MSDYTDKEIKAAIREFYIWVEKQSFLTENSYQRSIADFRYGSPSTKGGSFDEMEKVYTAFREGNILGEVTVEVRPVHAGEGVELTEELLDRINTVKETILSKALEELMPLRQERKILRLKSRLENNKREAQLKKEFKSSGTREQTHTPYFNF